MGRFMVAAGVLACLTLAGCGEPKTDEVVAEAPRKSLARSVPLYAGQDLVASVQSASVEQSADGGLDLKVQASTTGPGWTQPTFQPRIYAASPPDGVYEVDVIANQPAAPAGDALTPIEVTGAWDRYKDGRVKGVRFMSKTNDVVAMLPAK